MVCKERKRSVLNFLPKSALQAWLHCSSTRKTPANSWTFPGQDFISRWLSLLFSLKQFILSSNTSDCHCSSPRFSYAHDLIRLVPCFSFLFLFHQPRGNSDKGLSIFSQCRQESYSVQWFSRINIR